MAFILSKSHCISFNTSSFVFIHECPMEYYLYMLACLRLCMRSVTFVLFTFEGCFSLFLFRSHANTSHSCPRTPIRTEHLYILYTYNSGSNANVDFKIANSVLCLNYVEMHFVYQLYISCCCWWEMRWPLLSSQFSTGVPSSPLQL